ncbi:MULTISPECIES: ClpXP protease specificity-enhancing factor [Corallincola]|uniref:ClpXP protease specificity-enhancing factor n=3 Tax=Corallincola TaxID=1775176 RepID=A0A368NKL2_9GAMM|nr:MULTISPECIES: ClpXP protease specificity-enhancing factor [Corallincola]RCU49871.1 ClpXP protease specificity-enhancing factor [Corallincola holothuriorum]TAA45149.1 ClpXP protease specificity-enhancing factor [Corallincola spongiicola]TCI03574.1 ClpXP protease specificity-enhancing factor [Corallincola luteus]
MTPSRPYLLRAFYEWLVDNNLTPHVVVDATVDAVKVPTQFVKHGQIVLNLAPHAVGQLELGNDAVSFSARFGGTPMSVYLPIESVTAIYARENGAGTVFADDIAPEADLEEQPTLVTSPVTDDDKPTPPSGGRPSLRVVK